MKSAAIIIILLGLAFVCMIPEVKLKQKERDAIKRLDAAQQKEHDALADLLTAEKQLQESLNNLRVQLEQENQTLDRLAHSEPNHVYSTIPQIQNDNPLYIHPDGSISHTPEITTIHPVWVTPN